MATPQVTLGEAEQPKYAGLGARLGAYFIDLVIAFAVLMAVSLTMRSLRALGVWTPAPLLDPEAAWRAMDFGRKLLVLAAFAVATGALQVIVLQSSPWQATVGKRLLNIYVTDNAGRRITIARSWTRWIVRGVIDLFGGWLVSLILIAATRKKKALHDEVASTVVLRGRPVPQMRLEPWRLPVAFGLSFVWLVLTFVITM